MFPFIPACEGKCILHNSSKDFFYLLILNCQVLVEVKMPYNGAQLSLNLYLCCNNSLKAKNKCEVYVKNSLMAT